MSFLVSLPAGAGASAPSPVPCPAPFPSWVVVAFFPSRSAAGSFAARASWLLPSSSFSCSGSSPWFVVVRFCSRVGRLGFCSFLLLSCPHLAVRN